MRPTTYRLVKPGHIWIVACALTIVCDAAPTFAQSTAPSSITPPILRPPPESGSPPAVVPQAERLTPPAGSDTLAVRIGSIEVEGVFPEVRDDVRAIIADHENRTVTLAEIYAVASAIEAAHIRHGFVLARIVVPPQKLAEGGPVRLALVDGFIEDIDVSGLPRRIRATVARRLAGLKGRRHLTLHQIEQPLVLAGTAPGLRLTSTLAQGTEVGGARLLLSGGQSPVTGSVSVDNGYAASLGRYGITAQVSFNSAFGMGEQVYGFAVSGYDIPRAFRSSAPVRVLGGGGVFTSGNGRLSINPEVTFSRTQPLPQAGVPATRGKLRRLSLRGGYVIERTRNRGISLGATIEQIEESSDAIQFATRLSLDRFTVGRLQLNYSTTMPGGGGFALAGQVSHGLGGLDPLAAGSAPSRQGAHTDFTKLTMTLRGSKPIAQQLTLNLVVRAQTSLGQPLFRSEQAALEGSDALSGYVGGETAVDSNVAGRVELARPLGGWGPGGLIRLSPYVFAAAGKGWIAHPTALEAAVLDLQNLGSGVRGTVARTGLSFALEYAHGLSTTRRFDGTDRLSVSASIGF